MVISPQRRQAAIDVALVLIAVSAAVVAVVIDVESQIEEFDAADIALSAAGGLTVLGRRSWPLVMTVIAVAIRAVVIGTVGAEIGLVPAVVICLYALARRGDRTLAIATAVAASLVSTVVIVRSSSDPLVAELMAELALFLGAVAWGDANRVREQRLADRIDAAAEERVADEKLRIARDLHDIVAHSLSEIAVQSGVAAHVLDDREPATRAALERINESGKRALEELRSMLGVLRSTDEAPRRPIPTDPDNFDELFDRTREAGVDLQVSANGNFPDHVSDVSVVATHRIMAEALANVVRHNGAVATSVELRHGDADVTVRIVNDGGDASFVAEPSSGVGVLGMSERARALGGSLHATANGSGGFEVHAVLPYEPTKIQ